MEDLVVLAALVVSKVSKMHLSKDNVEVSSSKIHLETYLKNSKSSSVEAKEGRKGVLLNKLR